MSDSDDDPTTTLFDAWCESEGIDPDEAAVADLYRSWTAARDHFFPEALRAREALIGVSEAAGGVPGIMPDPHTLTAKVADLRARAREANRLAREAVYAADARWETVTTWGHGEPTSSDQSGPGWVHTEPPPPDGLGWEPFASGIGVRHWRVDRLDRVVGQETPSRFTVWRRRVRS